MLDKAKAALVVIDFQDGLLPAIPVASSIVPQAAKLIRCCRELGVPVLWTEQYPKGLGRTTKLVADALEGLTPIGITIQQYNPLADDVVEKHEIARFVQHDDIDVVSSESPTQCTAEGQAGGPDIRRCRKEDGDIDVPGRVWRRLLPCP